MKTLLLPGKFLDLNAYNNTGKFPKILDFNQPSRTESLHGDLQANPEFLVVESLSDYLRETSPPSSVKDTLNLWNSAAGIFKWVDLQNDELSYESLSRRSATYANYFSRHKVTCWHLDLKPENILVSGSTTKSPYVCRWKIGDLGISYIKQKDVLKEGMHSLGAV
jgi:hypothetical protein